MKSIQISQKKKVGSLFVALAMTLCLSNGYAIKAESAGVGSTIEQIFANDSNMANAVAQSLGKPVGEVVTATDVELTKELNLSSKDIAEVTGIEVFSNLVKINLYNNRLVSLPETIGSLSNLKILNLDKNSLTALPQSIGNLTMLEDLYINRNQLISLPESFGNLSSLSYLDLPDNQLVALPDSFGNLANLENLDITTNQITCLPSSIINLHKLSTLWMSGNPIVDLSLAQQQALSTVWPRWAGFAYSEEYENALAKKAYSLPAFPIYTQITEYGNSAIQYRLVQPDATEKALTPTFENGRYSIDKALLQQVGQYSVIAKVAGGYLTQSEYTQQFTLTTCRPVISLNGLQSIDLPLGTKYIEAGCTAVDSVDGDLTASVVIGGQVVNDQVPGMYEVTYTVGNSFNIISTLARSIHVLEASSASQEPSSSQLVSSGAPPSSSKPSSSSKPPSSSKSPSSSKPSSSSAPPSSGKLSSSSSQSSSGSPPPSGNRPPPGNPPSSGNQPLRIHRSSSSASPSSGSRSSSGSLPSSGSQSQNSTQSVGSRVPKSGFNTICCWLIWILLLLLCVLVYLLYRRKRSKK